MSISRVAIARIQCVRRNIVNALKEESHVPGNANAKNVGTLSNLVKGTRILHLMIIYCLISRRR